MSRKQRGTRASVTPLRSSQVLRIMSRKPRVLRASVTPLRSSQVLRIMSRKPRVLRASVTPLRSSPFRAGGRAGGRITPSHNATSRVTQPQVRPPKRQSPRGCISDEKGALCQPERHPFFQEGPHTRKIANSVVIGVGKGGVGKTALATTLSALWAAEHELRVLLVDCDVQASATRTMGPDPVKNLNGPASQTLSHTAIRRLSCRPQAAAASTLSSPAATRRSSRRRWSPTLTAPPSSQTRSPPSKGARTAS